MNDFEADELENIHQEILDADIVAGPEELYEASKLWPDLLNEIKPPHRLMH
jgi:hypothetical protein